jgi:hypothetical protein
MPERGTYCGECGRRVTLTNDGMVRKHNRGPKNRGNDYPCIGSQRPPVERTDLDAKRALR